ncbi:uncharacterized protein LOC134818849 isoform X2 [Bolinopsis microptera]|uniref:uncharacterized protein LOC134818849 isoform X2 n=1 Tax=Bolinopsis microptera TaxID=2820187 RepID=UPI003079A5F1
MAQPETLALELSPKEKIMEKMSVAAMQNSMEMPSMSGVSLNVMSNKGFERRSSMFAAHPKVKHGVSEIHSRGSFSLKGHVDPAVGLVASSGDIERLSDVSDIPKELVRQTESKDSMDSNNARRKKSVPQYENTYRMEPTRKPTRKELTNLFEKVLSDIPSEKANSPDFHTGVKLGQDLADEVIAECHNLEVERYRFVCLSTVISREGTSAYQASRLLSDQDRDTWEEASLKLANVNIHLQLYCVYLD